MPRQHPPIQFSRTSLHASLSCWTVNINLDGRYDADKSGPLTKENIAAHNFFWYLPAQFKRDEDVAGALNQFLIQMSAVMLDHVGDYFKRKARKDTASL